MKERRQMNGQNEDVIVLRNEQWIMVEMIRSFVI